ncbi:helix-turn-helix domain-containing protein [Halobacillus yeomjeoni]|nr:helix-turn-helix transcriptional regulator [Halobacillus yeomjeoni]
MKDPVRVRLLIGEKWSIREFSRECGISQPYLSQILSGKRNPSTVVAHKVSKALGMKLEDIFFIEVDNKRYNFGVEGYDGKK